MARPGLLVTAHAHLYRLTPRVSDLLVYIILRARLSARTTTDATARRTRLHASLPCHPSPVRSTIVTDVTVTAAHTRLCRRLSPGTVGALAPTSTAAPRGVDTPFHSIDRPSFRTVYQRRRRLHDEFACAETGNSHTRGPLLVSPHSYTHRQQGDVTDATALVGRRPASPPPLTRVTAAPAQHDRRGAHGSPPPLFCFPSPTHHVRRHARSSSRDSSHDERRLDFSTRHHSRASTSHSRSRSRSRSQDEHNTSLSFSSKLTLVRDIFAAEPSMQERPPMPPRSANVNVGSQRPSSSSSKPRSLPWNLSAARIHDSYWDLLRGKDPKSKQGTSNPWNTSFRHERNRQQIRSLLRSRYQRRIKDFGPVSPIPILIAVSDFEQTIPT